MMQRECGRTIYRDVRGDAEGKVTDRTHTHTENQVLTEGKGAEVRT